MKKKTKKLDTKKKKLKKTNIKILGGYAATEG